jgi:hypothetical protein
VNIFSSTFSYIWSYYFLHSRNLILQSLVETLNERDEERQRHIDLLNRKVEEANRTESQTELKHQNAQLRREVEAMRERMRGTVLSRCV